MNSLKSLRSRLSQASDPPSASRASLSHREVSSCDPKTATTQLTIAHSISPQYPENGGNANQRSSAHLLNVPPEIRNIIYSYLSLDMQITETIEAFVLPPYKIKRKYRSSLTITDDRVHKNVIRHRMPALTQVCRQLRSDIIAYPIKQCSLTLSSRGRSCIFTPSCSWLNYDMISHIRIPQYSRVETVKIRQHCKRLRSVIVDSEWRPYYKDSELPDAVDKLQRYRARFLSVMHPPTTDVADVYWSAIDSFVSTYAWELCCLRMDILVLGLDLQRTFELELRYRVVLSADGSRTREQAKSLNWDTGVISSIGAPVEYYVQAGRAEE